MEGGDSSLGVTKGVVSPRVRGRNIEYATTYLKLVPYANVLDKDFNDVPTQPTAGRLSSFDARQYIHIKFYAPMSTADLTPILQMYPYYGKHGVSSSETAENSWYLLEYPTYDVKDIRWGVGVDDVRMDMYSYDGGAYQTAANELMNTDFTNTVHGEGTAEFFAGQALAGAAGSSTVNAHFPYNPLPTLGIRDFSQNHITLSVEFGGAYINIEPYGKKGRGKSLMIHSQFLRLPHRIKTTGGILENSLNKRV